MGRNKLTELLFPYNVIVNIIIEQHRAHGFCLDFDRIIERSAKKKNALPQNVNNK